MFGVWLHIGSTHGSIKKIVWYIFFRDSYWNETLFFRLSNVARKGSVNYLSKNEEKKRRIYFFVARHRRVKLVLPNSDTIILTCLCTNRNYRLNFFVGFFFGLIFSIAGKWAAYLVIFMRNFSKIERMKRNNNNRKYSKCVL